VDVGNLLQLQRALQRDGVVRAAAQEQRVLLVGELLGQRGDGRLLRQRASDFGRQLAQLADQPRLNPRGHVKAPP